MFSATALWYKPSMQTLGSSALLQALNTSIGYDQRLLRADIQGSMAHVAMLAHVGLLTSEETLQLQEGLKMLQQQHDSGTLALEHTGYEDVHSFIEGRLGDLVGEVAKKLHTGRSRNDQVSLAMRLYLRETLQHLCVLIESYQLSLTSLAARYPTLWMPGYTHLQQAMPVIFADHVMAYHAMAQRDHGRVQDALKRLNVSPLGAGAMAGSSLPLDRTFVANTLGMSGIMENTLDAVASRDFVLEVLSALSILMVHLSRLAEELILWSSQEFQFVSLPVSVCTGSSMMPHKKNPDLPELVRGKTGRVFGSLMGMLTVMKALPLAYNKDMQEDKEGLFDALDTASLCVQAMQTCLEGLEVNEARVHTVMLQGRDALQATWLAEYLVNKHVPFREAYRVVAEVLAQCHASSGFSLHTFPLPQYQGIHPAFEEDVYQVFKLNTL
ncbi:MAG: argininosuccinate lyase [Vampirovibrionales bacterium]